MKDMHELKEKLWEEVAEINRKGDLSAGDLEAAHKLTDTIKNIDKICMLEEDGYSLDGEDYGGGSSYANRGKHYVRGHYSRNGENYDDGYSGRRNARGGIRGGYSREDGKSEMLEYLQMALDSADEQDREAIRRMIQRAQRA